VEPPEEDEELNGHSAVERSGTVHAVVTEYETGSGNSVILCSGRDVDWPEGKPRVKFEGEGVGMCDKCWPDTVLD
jgi:hypothetical protein